MRPLRVVFAVSILGSCAAVVGLAACGSSFRLADDVVDGDSGDGAGDGASRSDTDGGTDRDATLGPHDAGEDSGDADRDHDSGDAGLADSAPDTAAPIVDLIAANVFSCAMRADGTTSCWGDDQYGELGSSALNVGDGGATIIPAPQRIPSFPSTPRAISGSDLTGCALLQDQTVACWGYDGYGQAAQPPVPSEMQPVRYPGVQNVRQISVGLSLVCARVDALDAGAGAGMGADAATQTVCWGLNTRGDTGGQLDAGIQPPTVVSKLGNSSQIAVYQGISCALAPGGFVDCWGEDAGVKRVSLADGGAFGNVTQVTTGLSFACALRTDGTVWCWGQNEYGQLGRGSASVPTSAPTTKVLLSDATSISAGAYHACAILDGGALDCWGLDHVHQTGDPTSSSTACSGLLCNPTPVVQAIEPVTQVASGFITTLAIGASGEVYAWGNNSYGQLGYAPLPLDGGAQVCDVGTASYACNGVPTRVRAIP